MDTQALDQQLRRTSVGQVPMDRLHSIFDAMFDGVWLVAADGRTTYANGAMAGLLGSTPNEMRGHRSPTSSMRPCGLRSRASWRVS